MNEQGTFGGPGGQAAGASGGAAEVMKDEAQRLASEVKGETARMASQAREQATQLVDRTKDQTAQRLGSLASALRQAARQLETDDAAGFGRYAGMAADQVDKVADYVGGRDLRELVRDTETFARRHPDLFLGGAFVAGVMLARFVKSSRPQPEPLTPSGDTRYETAALQPVDSPRATGLDSGMGYAGTTGTTGTGGSGMGGL